MALSTIKQPTGGAMKWLSARLLILLFTATPVHAATIYVNTTQQGITNGQCSLQEAIYASRFQANTAVSSVDPETFYTTGCAAGTGDDFIVLPAGAVFTFNHPWGDDQNVFGPTATPIIFSKITIEGNGATLQWVDAAASPRYSRLFVIPPWVVGQLSLTLRNVYIKGFHIKGGNGGRGGGGGLGAGGAIYVSGGRLTVENSTFENNGAIGGNGGATVAGSVNGGGGGLSGNGGEGCALSAGGGGGSRGDGGNGAVGLECHLVGARLGGGGGGGNISSGADATASGNGRGGLRWGGNGGNEGGDGHDPTGPGGGGGGGGGVDCVLPIGPCYGNGAHGSYGGGGGGGVGNGGNGGFGGGGGGSSLGPWFIQSGGDGGFGGGGGRGGIYAIISNHQGEGGPFGGRADPWNGGGGGALGGAIFNDNGVVRIRNSTFYNNYVTRGAASGGSAENGADAGGAIFSLNRALEITDSTFSGNQATGSGAAIVVYRDDHAGWGSGGSVNFSLYNTIIANNGANECFFTGNVTAKGAGNLIMNNGSGTAPFSPCPGVVVTSDPLLGPLQLNSPGVTPTMALSPRSPAIGAADPATSLPFDQRYVTRPRAGAYDIGAFELEF
jgi:hypothetical protein